jgi:hypothetical protein
MPVRVETAVFLPALAIIDLPLVRVVAKRRWRRGEGQRVAEVTTHVHGRY